jgi:aspartate/glutamate racemase
MLEQVRRHGSLEFEGVAEDNIPSSDALDRLGDHILAAEDIGADAVLVTCSTVSPYLDQIPAEIPVLKIDQAMMEQAVAQGERIGVLATNPTTLEPTRQALLNLAEEEGKPVKVKTLLVEGAFAALLGGDAPTHDRLVQEAIEKISAGVDLVVLAQASMARVLETFPEARRGVPVLTSPHTALERVKQILEDGQR